MPSSNKIVKIEGALQRVLEYHLQKFDLGVPKQAKDFVENQRAESSGFRMSDAQKIQTGVKSMEAASFQEEVEKKTLERLKEIQEPAYAQAYQLGLVEGRKEAFIQTSREIEHCLTQLSDLVNTISTLKTDMAKYNEAHLIKLCMHIASKIAFHDVKVNDDALLQMIIQAVESARGEETLNIRVSPAQLKFLESLKAETSHHLEFLNRVKWIPDDDMSEGDCVILTNYGEIDGRFGQRIERLWTTFSEVIFQVKDKVSAA